MNINKWINKNITRNFINKNILITGSNSGIGFETSKHFIRMGANIIMAIRNLERGNKAKELLLKEYPDAKISIYIVDQSSKKSIDNFIAKIKEDNLDIDIVIHNAGVLNLPYQKSVDNKELVLATNYLGVKYLNDLLLDYLATLNHEVEIVLTTSISYKVAKINYSDFYNEAETKYKKFRAYANSKLCIIHYFEYLININKNPNFKFYLTHPGATYTPLIGKAFGVGLDKLARKFMKYIFNEADKASLSILLALNNQINGSFYGPTRLLGLTGYPHKLKIRTKYIRNYIRTISY